MVIEISQVIDMNSDPLYQVWQLNRDYQVFYAKTSLISNRIHYSDLNSHADTYTLHVYILVDCTLKGNGGI